LGPRDNRGSLVESAVIRKEFRLVEFKAPCLENRTGRFVWLTTCLRSAKAWAGESTLSNAPFLPLAAAGRLQLKFIVIFVCADPEPVVMAISLAGESAIAATDLDGVNAAFLTKA
jgi:hypothetical protein